MSAYGADNSAEILPTLATPYETPRGPDFLRLANALSAVYPKDSGKKRLLNAMLLATPKT